MNEYTTTITVTETNGDIHTIENARVTGIVGGYVCIQKVEWTESKNARGMEVTRGTITNHYVPMSDVASIVLAEATIDGEDTYEAVGQDFNADWSALSA